MAGTRGERGEVLEEVTATPSRPGGSAVVVILEVFSASLPERSPSAVCLPIGKRRKVHEAHRLTIPCENDARAASRPLRLRRARKRLFLILSLMAGTRRCLEPAKPARLQGTPQVQGSRGTAHCVIRTTYPPSHNTIHMIFRITSVRVASKARSH